MYLAISSVHAVWKAAASARKTEVALFRFSRCLFMPSCLIEYMGPLLCRLVQAVLTHVTLRERQTPAIPCESMTNAKERDSTCGVAHIYTGKKKRCPF